jgi:hypothetical protein
MKNIALRLFAFSLLFSITATVSVNALAVDDGKVVIGYFSTEKQEDFEKKIKPVFEQLKGSCKNCELMNLTPYDDKGNYSEKDLLEKVKNPPVEMAFYFFSWNKKATDQSHDLIQVLSDKVDSGKLVIAPAGHAADGEPGLSLSRTIMGQSKDVIIIGEITGNERILPQSYFGPEMMTAIRAPKEFQGQGYSPLYFATRLAAVWSKRKPAEWLQHFKTKKIKSRKIWLDADDLLGR